MTLLLYFGIMILSGMLVLLLMGLVTERILPPGFLAIGPGIVFLCLAWIFVGGMISFVTPSPTYDIHYEKSPINGVINRNDESFVVVMVDESIDPIIIDQYKYSALKTSPFIIVGSHLRNAWGVELNRKNILLDETVQCVTSGSARLPNNVIINHP